LIPVLWLFTTDKKIRMRIELFYFLFPLAFWITPDDGWLGSRGGSIFPIIRNENIRMIKEEIYINIRSQDSVNVSCKFWFKNETKKPQTNIYMGFPDAYDDEPGKVSDSQPIKHFTCKINGIKKEVKKEVQNQDFRKDTSTIYYPAWYCWHADFKPGETIIIENAYTGELGGDVSGSLWFSYIIGTANTWHNSIGQGKVVYKYSNMIAKYNCNAEVDDHDSDGLRKGMSVTSSKDSSVFLFKDYRPKNYEELRVFFFPKRKDIKKD